MFTKRTQAPVFLLGCYRSGKTTLLKTIEHHPDCSIFHESNSVAYKDYRIRSERKVKSLVRKNSKNIIIFELVNDLQHADRFLDLHARSRAIWIYRHYQDVIQAAIESWGTVWRDIIGSVAGKTDKHPYQQKLLLERMNPETLEIIKAYHRDDMSSADGAALLWYARNTIYFDLGMDRDERVLTVKYEDLLLQSEFHVKRILDFIAPSLTSACPTFPHSLATATRVEHSLIPEITRVCDDLLRRLDEQYGRQLRAQKDRSGLSPHSPNQYLRILPAE